jgi:drug/metabolite transporter (DMT)-like permease
MSPRAIGVLLGSIAAGTFEVSYLLLAAQARRATTAVRPDAAFLGRLARRPWWLVAMGLNGVAFVLELAALRRVPLLVVQPLLSLGLVGLVVGARLFLGERIGRRQMIGVVLVGVGVTLVVAGTPASGGAVGLRVDGGSFAVALVLLAVLAFPQFGPGGSAWRLVAAAAGGDTLVALATNEVAAAWSGRLLVVLGGVLAVAVCGLAAVSSESAALQRLPASRVGPIVSGAQITLPVLLVALLDRQSWGPAPAGGGVLALGVLLVGGGVLCLGAADADATVRLQGR